MATAISGTTGITFTDATTQNTAAASTAGNGISISSGTIALGVPTGSSVGTYTAGSINVNSTTYSIGATQAGSTICYLNVAVGGNNVFSPFFSNAAPTQTSLGLSGTWRACSVSRSVSGCCGTIVSGNLWIRIA